MGALVGALVGASTDWVVIKLSCKAVHWTFVTVLFPDLLVFSDLIFFADFVCSFEDFAL